MNHNRGQRSIEHIHGKRLTRSLNYTKSHLIILTAVLISNAYTHVEGKYERASGHQRSSFDEFLCGDLCIESQRGDRRLSKPGAGAYGVSRFHSSDHPYRNHSY